MNNEESKLNRDVVALEQQLQAAQQRMERLEQSAKDSSVESTALLPAETLNELSIALEELHVATEEIKVQNEELLSTHQSLELERQHFQELFEFAPDAYLATTIQGVIQSANRASEILLNLRRERLVGKPLIVFVAEADRIHFHAQLNHFAESQSQSLNDWEMYLKPRGRNPFPASISVSAIYDVTGTWEGLRWSIRDNSDRKHIELQLQATHDLLESQVEERTSELVQANKLLQQEISDRKQAEKKIREQAALIDISPDAIMVRDLDCHILFWNQGAEQIYGWTAAEILGRDSRELLSQKSLPILETALQTVLKTGEWRGEFQKVAKSGKEIQIGSRWKLLRDETEQPHAILTVETDITEQKQLEAQFLRAQRLESLGTLASGIAHDMNNILAPMLVSARLLPVLNPTLDEQSQQLLAIFEANARRGAELVNQILAFARGMEGERMNVQIKHILAELLQTIKSTFPKSIEIARTFPKQDLWMVCANATQLHQVFMNFCINARDAMPHGGTLSISAENKVIDKAYVRMNLDAKVGSYVAITFGDTGTGIAPEHIDRIFEPFFTTKAIGKGTGLGLSTVIGIVKNHGGFTTVSSKIGQGTQFQVFFPAVETTVSATVETREPSQGQGELILIVDDEANIREALKITLEAQNYQVLLAADGIEAITVYAQHQNIKVVLLDMLIPSLSSATAIQVFRQFNQQVKIIACSGVPASNILLEMNEVKAFLPKPFTSEDLLNTLHRVINEG